MYLDEKVTVRIKSTHLKRMDSLLKSTVGECYSSRGDYIRSAVERLLTIDEAKLSESLRGGSK